MEGNTLTVALLDGDIIAYKQAIISTDTYEDTSIYDPVSVKRNIQIMVDEWAGLAKAGKILVCLSSDDHRYFRHIVYPDYKGNRSKTERPVALECAYATLKENYQCVQHDGLEADDVMGILAGNPNITDPVIVSIDKDMMTIPGKVLNPNKMRRALKIRKPVADRNMLIQAMAGDSTDNYPGIPGIGPVKAAALLDQHPTPAKAWPSIVRVFGSEKKALTMVRLARILRYQDWNEEKGEVRLWHPTQKDIWIKSTPPTIEKETASKPSTTSSQSVETSPETKPSSSETLSDTSRATKKSIRKRRKSTLKKRSGTSKGSSKSYPKSPVKPKRQST